VIYPNRFLQANFMNFILRTLGAGLLCAVCLSAHAQTPSEYLLGPGDIIKVTVFQNPDLATEARVSEASMISFPLVGSIALGGLSVQAAEQRIAQALKDGGFVKQAQVNVLPVQIRGSQVAVLGQVNRPGRFPLETSNIRLSDMLAIAGGISNNGSDEVQITGMRGGKAFRKTVNVASMYLGGNTENDIMLAGGDTLYVHRAPMFFIYGEVQRPGTFRVERDMTLMQALATGGGLNLRGTLRGIAVHRRNADGKVVSSKIGLDEKLQPDDVIYVQESLF
jgi:polysaccharide biosynthesis/export protein